MEEMEEPWEALDLDETDIFSSISILRRCTQQPSISSQSPQSSLPPSTQSTTTVSRRRLIPGPAAAIQAAMHRIEQSNLNQNHFSQISTQGYIQRVQQDADEEFSRNPWLFAVNFLRRQCVLDTTPLSGINKCENAERFDKVVAVVKSCTPNGLGDMIVTLKDPSDTIGASIHGKVFNVGDFGNFISVGAILILQKVVAFSSSSTSSYLNITRSNIDKVISVDCEIKDFPEANPDNTQVFSRSLVISEGTSALVSRRAERVVADVHHLKGKAVMQELTQKTNHNQPKILSSSTQIDNRSLKTLNEPIQIDPVCSGPSIWEGDHSARVSQPDPYSLEGVVSNFKDFENIERTRQAGEFSSAPYISETRGNPALQANGTQFERQLLENNLNQSANEKLKKIVDIGKCSRMLNNVDDVNICGVDDNQKQHPKKIGSVSSIIENLAKRDFSEINGCLKSVCQTENGVRSNVNVQQSCEEAGKTIGIKKPRLKLVSRNAVQEWTDEQLCILDMDEY